MKAVVIFSLMLSPIFCCAQPDPNSIRNEFSSDGKGLMYSASDMNHLRKIVDSLNIRFRSCDLNRPYQSLLQTNSYYVYFQSEKNPLTDIVKSLEKNEDYVDVIKKYKPFVSENDTADWVVEGKYIDEGKIRSYYLHGSPGEGYSEIYRDTTLRKRLSKSRWVYEYSKKDKYSDYYSIIARYFPTDFIQTRIPDEYARLIQYVDCMIDTTANIFLTDNYLRLYDEKGKKKQVVSIKRIQNYFTKYHPELSNSSSDLSSEQYDYAVKHLKDNTEFRQLLASTIDEYYKNKSYNTQLGSLAEKLGLYDKALLMKRSYRIVGNCSQDSRPREHAREIAILAAQSNSWDIFLRAHLDIMNDRFERMSDGSYAYSQRKTYLKELEELNLNIVDLMLGLTLHAKDLSFNHYYGTVWRIGWALTESNEKERFEKMAFQMIKDHRLDKFNRGLVFLLYTSYLYRLGDKKLIEEKIQTLKSDVQNFPDFVQPHILALTVKERE